MPSHQIDTEGDIEVQLGEVPDTSSRYIVEMSPEKYGDDSGFGEHVKKDE